MGVTGGTNFFWQALHKGRGEILMIISGFLVCTLALAGYATSVVAEDRVLEEVVVTAQKREQNLGDVPVVCKKWGLCRR